MQTIAGIDTAEMAALLRSLGIRIRDLESVGDLFVKVDLKALIPVLQDAAEQFGVSSELALERHRELNPEGDCLVLQVRQVLYAADLMDQIDRFAKAHENELSFLEGFMISTDFQHPSNV